MILSKRCEVRYCQEKQSWRLYDENDNPIDGECYETRDEAIKAGRCFCEETGDELCIFDKNSELVSKRKVNNKVGE